MSFYKKWPTSKPNLTHRSPRPPHHKTQLPLIPLVWNLKPQSLMGMNLLGGSSKLINSSSITRPLTLTTLPLPHSPWKAPPCLGSSGWLAMANSPPGQSFYKLFRLTLPLPNMMTPPACCLNWRSKERWTRIYLSLRPSQIALLTFHCYSFWVVLSWDWPVRYVARSKPYNLWC